MMNEVVNFDATRNAIVEAKTVNEVLLIRDKMAAMVAFYKAKRDPGKALQAAELKLFAEARMGEMSMTLESRPAKGNQYSGKVGGADLTKQAILASAGISKQEASMFERLAKMPKEELTKAAYEGLTARKLLRKRMTADELQAAGLSPHTDRYHTTDGKTATRVKIMNDEIRVLRERVVELEKENARLNKDLEALQTGNIMQISHAALLQRKQILDKMTVNRKKRRMLETLPDEKTKEEFERQIKTLKAQLRVEKSKVLAFSANGKTIFDKQGYKGILVCLHPDGALDVIEKERREKAFKLFTGAVSEPEF